MHIYIIVYVYMLYIIVYVYTAALLLLYYYCCCLLLLTTALQLPSDKCSGARTGCRKYLTYAYVS